MINFIYGVYGGGKTEKIFSLLAKDAQEHKRSFLIVPDQEALNYERISLEKLPASSQLTLEILSFSRLYNRVCREYGGLSYSYITKPLRSLLMWKALRELSPLLEFFGKDSPIDINTADELLSTLDELKANGITDAQLKNAHTKLKNNPLLLARLKDIYMVSHEFNRLVSEKYSDSADDLNKLYDLLEKNDFFADANIYIDAFTSFTAVQHNIIQQMFRQADNVTVTFPLPYPEYEDISTMGICASHERLLLSAKDFGGAVVLEENKFKKNLRAKSAPLAYLSENLWNMSASRYSAPMPDGSIVAEICNDPYAECEAVAAHICELLRGGARCRDTVIIARDCESYRGIIDTALRKCDIPCYIAEKSELCLLPPVKLILSAIAIKKYNWQKNDVISHIKTGLCDIDIRDAELFEEYVNTWNINGDRFFESWEMNPDGFSKNTSSRGNNILNAANRVRQQLVAPLQSFFDALDHSNNIPDMCRAIYGYMCSVSLESKLASLAQKASLRGDLKQARELSKIYDVMLCTLADTGEALSDSPQDYGEGFDKNDLPPLSATERDALLDELIVILRNIFSKTEIATIPTSIDEVTIGSAAMLRTSNFKYAFILGLCEGEFPASVSDSGIFSAIDRENLLRAEIVLSSNNDIRSSDELMYVARAFSVASERLYLFTHSAEISGTTRFPSLAFNRVIRLFDKRGKFKLKDASHRLAFASHKYKAARYPKPKLYKKLSPHVYSVSDLDYALSSAKNAVGILYSLEEGVYKESLKTALSHTLPKFSDTYGAALEITECNISPSTVSAIFGNAVHLSPSSFEKYVSCPFSFFCDKALKLREPTDSKFNDRDIGNFIHHVLEKLIKATIPDSPTDIPPDDEEIIKNATEAADAYIAEICPSVLIDSKRLQHLYSRLKKQSAMLIRNTVREFSSSDFRPVLYEFKLGGKGEEQLGLVFTLKDGSSVCFSGQIDRVDIYKSKDKVYLRVVDYKSGSKDFKLEDIKYGMNLQMLLYLFSLCKSNSKNFRQMIDVAENQELSPAGIMYISSNVSMIAANDFLPIDETLSLVESKLGRTGLVLNDAEVLNAVNRNADKSFIAAIKTGSSISHEKARISAEGFEDIYNDITSTVIKIASELRGGRADAHPFSQSKDYSPCTYCKAKPLCRKINR